MRGAARALLVVFVFAIPWQYSLDLGAPFGNVARMLGLMTALAAIAAVLQKLQFRKLKTVHWLTATLYLWFCASYFWTRTPHATLTHLRWYAQEMMLVWLIWEFTDSAEQLVCLMEAWLAGSWVLAALTIADFAVSTAQPGPERFAATGQDPNDVARFLSFGLPVAALLLDRGARRIPRVMAFGYLPVGFGCVLLTGSRSGMVAGLAALGGCGALAMIRHPRAAALATVAVITAAALTVTAVPEGTIGRLSSVSELWRHGDLNQRINIWSAGWRAFREAPIAGHGAGSFVEAAALGPDDTAHNTVLGLLVEGGLIALLLASGILASSFHAVVRSAEPFRMGLSVLMGIWVISSMVGTIGENRATWLLFGVATVSERLGMGSFDEQGPAFDVRGGERLYAR